jgi:hypothetical protein
VSIVSGFFPNVTLSVWASDNLSSVTHMMISNSPDFAGASWEPYAATKAWVLSGTAYGDKTVYARFRDAAGNVSGTYSATIRAPNPPVLLSSGTFLTTTPTLGWSYSDPAGKP